MSFLPIAERELRVAARKRSTFWIRVGAVSLTLVIAFSLLVIFKQIGGAVPNKGKILFGILSWMAFGYAFAAGVFLTADSLSEEKREGTLGLLFLTDLRGYDVVLGKLAATSLHAVYGVVAAFPVLAISLLLGGLLGVEFWTGILAILNMLFVSLAAGLLASTLAREALLAMNHSVLLLGIAVGLPYLADVALAHVNGAKFSIQTGIAATLHPFLIATGTVSGGYWVSLLLSHAVGWLFLALAAWRVRHAWQEQPLRSASKKRKASGSTEEAERRTDEPIVWLAGRSKRFRLWVLLPLMAGVAVIGYLLDTGPVAVTIAIGLTNVLSLLLLFWMTAHATRFFVEGVRSGAFELILCTAMTPSEIVRGQWIVYMRTFGVPLVFLIFAEQILGSMQWAGTGLAANAYAIAGQVTSAVTSITTAGAIGWFGMWMGLRSRKPHIAVIKTFAFVFLLPAVAITILQTILVIAVSLGGGGGVVREIIGPTITGVLWVVKDAVFILWARRNLYGHFREGVAGINSPRPVFSAQKAIRSGLVGAGQT